MRIAVLGPGNSFHSDDSIGLLVVRHIQKLLENPGELLKFHAAGVEVTRVETEEMGLALGDFLWDHDWAIIVGEVQTGKAPPEFLHIFKESDLKVVHGASSHYTGIREVLTLGRSLRLPMPGDVTIFGVEVKTPFSFGNDLSPKLSEAVPRNTSSIVAF